MKITDKMVLFWRDEDIFSNFHPALFAVDGKIFHSSEQYFMYSKATYFHYADTAAKIIEESEPYICKKLGRQVKDYDEAVWNNVRESVMFDACYFKFRQNPNLKEQLIATQNRLLVEASPYDRIWGIGLGEGDDAAIDPKRWKGRNLLGMVLMNVRERLLKEKD